MESPRARKSFPVRYTTVLCTITLLAAGCGGQDAAPATSAQSSDTSASGSVDPSATAQSSEAPVSEAPAGGLFSAPAPWTTDVSSLPVSDRSAAIIAALNDHGGWGTETFNIDFSIPVFFADSSTPRMQVVGIDDYCFGGNACDEVPAEMPVPADAYIEGSSDLTCDITGETESQGDCHLLVVDRDAQQLYEIYQASSDGENITAGAFFVWDLTMEYPPTLRGEQCTSADAAGFPIAAMVPTADEVASGAVNHAIRFILPNDRMKAGVFVAPATHAGGPESSDPNAPPYGVRFRLNPDFDESSYSDGERVILQALKTYGMLLSDGGQVPLTFADDRTSSAKWADLGIDAQSFSDIGVDQFEVVDLGPEIELTYDCVRN